jgi:hypothetical protein
MNDSSPGGRDLSRAIYLWLGAPSETSPQADDAVMFSAVEIASHSRLRQFYLLTWTDSAFGPGCRRARSRRRRACGGVALSELI